MTKNSPDLSRIFQALADPTRRAMLARLASGPVPVTALAAPTGLALPTVLRHLAVLEAAALIATVKTGRVRLCHARSDALDDADDWLQAQRRLWLGRTDRMESLLTGMEADDDDPAEPRP